MSPYERRGGHYHLLRAGMERVLSWLYRGDWPAKLWDLYPPGRRVTCVRRSFACLPPSAASLRIGFVSDIHIGPTTPAALLDTAFAQLAAAKPDLLLLGGDYVFLEVTKKKAARLTELVQRVAAKRKFAVLGNHDLWTDSLQLEAALRAADVTVLANRHVVLAPGLSVIGLDDPWVGQLDVTRALAGMPDSSSVIVLCHSPDGFPAAQRAIAELPLQPTGVYLCGHTHGGHIAAPWGPIVVPGVVGKRYPHGFFHLPPLELFVSRGVGGIELPIRTYATPEVAVIDLHARASRPAKSRQQKRL
jgi:uncharacterized protein